MNEKLSMILKLASSLNKSELMTLNQAVISLIKTQQGVVTRKNPKTIQVTTPDNYYVNIPATYVSCVKNPSKELQDLRKKLVPPYEEMYEVLEVEIEKGTFH